VWCSQDQLSAFLGTSGAPSTAAVTVTLVSLLLVNALFYCALMHLLYVLILRGMGYEVNVPSIVTWILMSHTLPTSPRSLTRACAAARLSLTSRQ